MGPLEQLKSVLCDPDGKCCIAGSDEDRAIIDRALQALAAPVQPKQEPVAWPCEIEGADFEQDTVTLKMLTSEYVVRAGKHWLSTTPPAAQPAPDMQRHNDYMAGFTEGYDRAEKNARRTTPPAQPAQRQPLTNEQINDMWMNRDCVAAIKAGDLSTQLFWFARAIEAAHNIKENT